MDVLGRYDDLVDDPASFRAACERPLPHCVRVNTIKTTVGRATAALDEAGVGWTARDWNPRLLEIDTDSPGRTWPYFLGWLHGQEEVSALPAAVLDPQSGERVLDACAAPGSKASQLAARMDDAGRLVANDANLGRLAALRSNLDRLGVTNAAVTNQDARSYSLRPFGGREFDRALVDAPCSGVGAWRRHPDARWRLSEADLDGHTAAQDRVLRQAADLVRPGGRLVYATCSLLPCENARRIEAFRRERQDFAPLPVERAWAEGVGGTCPGAGEHLLLTPAGHGTDGFFVAVLERSEASWA